MTTEAKPEDHSGSRRDFLKTTAAAGAAAAATESVRDAPGRGARRRPQGSARRPRQAAPALHHSRRCGDDDGPEHAQQGRVRPRRTCWSRARRSSPSGRTCTRAAPAEIDARGKIVMPGFVDTHHHQAWTAHQKLHSGQHPDRRRLGHAERGTELFRQHSARFRPQVPAAGRVHQRAVRRPGAARQRRHDGRTTSRRSITRPSTRTPPSRRCSIPGAAPPSASSRAPGPPFSAPIPTTSIRRTPPASRSSGSRRAISSST